MKRMPQIKICGITRPEEIEFLNENEVDYAGFVFFEKSKRNVTVSQAKKLVERLDKKIKRTAVTVSPDEELVQSIEQEGFDILQVHGEAKERLEWEQAFSIPQITGFVVDGASYGGGETFRWENAKASTPEAIAFRGLLQKIKEKTFILAGGLKAQNVSEGIRIFSPDVVDVSSGVEGKGGKDKEKMKEFVKKVQRSERNTDCFH